MRARMPRDEPLWDWNAAAPRRRLLGPESALLDETLRDGIQNPSVRDPSAAEKLELLELMDGLGIQLVNVGLPAASRRNLDDCVALCRAIVDRRRAIRPVAAGRTVVGDVEAILRVADAAGAAPEAYLFIGSSPIRQLAESWDAAFLARSTEQAIDRATRAGLAACFVAEDTSRSRPEVLQTLWRAAIDAGARRICLADTVGHATPDGLRNLVMFAADIIRASGADVRLDWHGHNDRGLALDNALWALELGVERIHATALGIGERTGNVSMELMLHNLRAMGELAGPSDDDLGRYCRRAARALGWHMPDHQAVVGRSALEALRSVP
jgi:2-isopropylmalate synthase